MIQAPLTFLNISGDIEVSILPGEYSDPSQLNFTWEVLEHNENILLIKLYFKDPLSVSRINSEDQV